jgi:hypothetical protein
MDSGILGVLSHKNKEKLLHGISIAPALKFFVCECILGKKCLEDNVSIVRFSLFTYYLSIYLSI